MARVVLDTNVLVSALIYEGKPRTLVLKLIETHTIILSWQLIAELKEVLTRDKFMVKPSEVNRFISILAQTSKIVQDHNRFKVVEDDPDDDVVFNVAYTGKADFIVTGDKHLLELDKFKKTRIVTVNQMLNLLT
jgi:uncharacterized protein